MIWNWSSVFFWPRNVSHCLPHILRCIAQLHWLLMWKQYVCCRNYNSEFEFLFFLRLAILDSSMELQLPVSHKVTSSTHAVCCVSIVYRWDIQSFVVKETLDSMILINCLLTCILSRSKAGYTKLLSDYIS